jgi:hypothetical protein
MRRRKSKRERQYNCQKKKEQTNTKKAKEETMTFTLLHRKLNIEHPWFGTH